MDEVRLIDANALKEEIEKMWGTPQNKIQVLKIIDNAPTINPEKKVKIPSCLTNPERQAELLERYQEE